MKPIAEPPAPLTASTFYFRAWELEDRTLVCCAHHRHATQAEAARCSVAEAIEGFETEILERFEILDPGVRRQRLFQVSEGVIRSRLSDRGARALLWKRVRDVFEAFEPTTEASAERHACSAWKAFR